MDDTVRTTFEYYFQNVNLEETVQQITAGMNAAKASVEEFSAAVERLFTASPLPQLGGLGGAIAPAGSTALAIPQTGIMGQGQTGMGGYSGWTSGGGGGAGWNRWNTAPTINVPSGAGQMTSGMMGSPAPDWTAQVQSMDLFIQKMSLSVGAMSNLIHTYYWLETAAVRMENAQLRLANSQDVYTKAVQTYGAGSQQAISAYRSLEIAENAVERAQAREILNVALIGIQLVMAVGRIFQMAVAWGVETGRIYVNTAALEHNARARNAVGIATSGMNAQISTGGVSQGLGGIIGGAGGGLLGGGAGLAMMGVMAAVTGALIIQQLNDTEIRKNTLKTTTRESAGVSGIDMGDIYINGLNQTDIDKAMDDKKSEVKNELRRILR